MVQLTDKICSQSSRNPVSASLLSTAITAPLCDTSMSVEIEGTEKTIMAMERWVSGELAYIERIEFQTANSAPASLTMIGLFQHRDQDIWPDINNAIRRVTLRFEGMNSLRLQEFGGGHVQIMGLEIRCIADRGWESGSFEIRDYENGDIELLC